MAATRKPKSSTKSYEVVGHHAVAGVKPGGTVTLDLTPEREKALITGGHIRPAGTTKTPAPAGDDGKA